MKTYEDKVREKLIGYKELYGSTNKFIASKIGVDNSTIGKFIKGKLRVSDATLRKIEKFIDQE